MGGGRYQERGKGDEKNRREATEPYIAYIFLASREVTGCLYRTEEGS